MQRFSSSVQQKGQVTIPQAIRDAFDIKPGDEVYFRRSPQGILITTEKLERLLRFDETLDELSRLLAEREQEEDFSLDVVFDEIRERRAEILREKYGVSTPYD
jgi:AbrB family looped-hinge helix DNA binding protein